MMPSVLNTMERRVVDCGSTPCDDRTRREARLEVHSHLPPFKGVTLIQTRPNWTSKSLADACTVEERTIFRDLAKLARMRRHRRVTGGVVRWVRDFAGRVAGLPSVACACARATRSSMDTASAAVGGRLCSPTLAQLWADGLLHLADAPLRRAARVARESSGETSPGSWPGRWKPEGTRARELARLYKGVRGHGRAHRGGCWWVLRDAWRAEVAIGGCGEG